MHAMYRYRGPNLYGGLAVPYTSLQMSSSPVRINMPEPVASVAAGSGFVVAALTTGEVFSWGRNNVAQVSII